MINYSKKPLSIAVALIVFLGLALHDTKLDSMTSFAIALPVVIATYQTAALHGLISTESHMHVERVSVDRLAGAYTSQLPKLKSNGSEDDTHSISRRSVKGAHLFDGYLYPLA